MPTVTCDWLVIVMNAWVLSVAAPLETTTHVLVAVQVVTFLVSCHAVFHIYAEWIGRCVAINMFFTTQRIEIRSLLWAWWVHCSDYLSTLVSNCCTNCAWIIERLQLTQKTGCTVCRRCRWELDSSPKSDFLSSIDNNQVNEQLCSVC